MSASIAHHIAVSEFRRRTPRVDEECVVLYAVKATTTLQLYLQPKIRPEIRNRGVSFGTIHRPGVPPLFAPPTDHTYANKSSFPRLSENTWNREETPCFAGLHPLFLPPASPSARHDYKPEPWAGGHLGEKPRLALSALHSDPGRPLSALLWFKMSLFHLQARDTQRPACSYIPHRERPRPRNLADPRRCAPQGTGLEGRRLQEITRLVCRDGHLGRASCTKTSTREGVPPGRLSTSCTCSCPRPPAWRLSSRACS